MSAGTTPRRIVSMDQFRGYTVAGMFLVNFLGGYAAIHPVLKHNNNYFSYADSIMPSFMFAVGFSFRLTYLRRRSQSSALSTVWTYVRRSLALIVVSVVMYGFGDGFRHFSDFDRMPSEYDPFRAKPTQTKSFDLLLAKAHEMNPSADANSIVESAKRIGSTIDHHEPSDKAEKEQFAVAKKAAETATAETKEFYQAALDRKATWDGLGIERKMLVHWRIFLAKLLKSDVWETLAIIGVTQLVVLPFIGGSFVTRFLAMIGLGVAHCFLSYWFNWDFVYAVNDPWLSKVLMTGDSRSWDGGLFGPLSWGVAMMAGTLAYDLVLLSGSSVAATGRLFAWGFVLMAIGYGMSCLTRLYDLSPSEVAARKEQQVRQEAETNWLDQLMKREKKKKGQASDPAAADRNEAAREVLHDQKQSYPNFELADSPVMPPWERLKGRSPVQLLAEPPFVRPLEETRPMNYWLMGKRMPSLSFITFATGFAFALYGFFVLACDVGGLRVGIFTTFGTNALAAYFLHHVVEESLQPRGGEPLVPHDAPLWYCLAGLGLFLVLTYGLVRFLEKRKIYIKL
jgi:predicted acyltransferase